MRLNEHGMEWNGMDKDMIKKRILHMEMGTDTPVDVKMGWIRIRTQPYGNGRACTCMFSHALQHG